MSRAITPARSLLSRRRCPTRLTQEQTQSCCFREDSCPRHSSSSNMGCGLAQANHSASVMERHLPASPPLSPTPRHAERQAHSPGGPGELRTWQPLCARRVRDSAWSSRATLTLPGGNAGRLPQPIPTGKREQLHTPSQPDAKGMPVWPDLDALPDRLVILLVLEQVPKQAVSSIDLVGRPRCPTDLDRSSDSLRPVTHPPEFDRRAVDRGVVPEPEQRLGHPLAPPARSGVRHEAGVAADDLEEPRPEFVRRQLGTD